MNFSWELVLYELNPKDMVQVFKTCRERRENSKRTSLWSFLLKRDFPNHVRKFSPPYEVHEEWYKDLYRNGAYLDSSTSVPIYPEIPLTCYRKLQSEIYLFAYRFRETKHLRRPDCKHIGIIRTKELDKHLRRQIRQELLYTMQGIDVRDMQMIIFSNMTLDSDFEEITIFPVPSAIINARLTWLRNHFQIRDVLLRYNEIPRIELNSRMSGPPNFNICSIRFMGILKPGSVLSYQQEVLRTYKTCGEGGGMTKKGPCKNKTLSEPIHTIPTHPNYGRCRIHPREVGDLSMYETKIIIHRDENQWMHLVYSPNGNVYCLESKTTYNFMNGKKIPKDL